MNGKYCRTERELRFLLPSLPTGLGEPTTIVDYYLPGTLRLRAMTTRDGTTYKLGQKYRAVGDGLDERTMTNLYVDEAEYRWLLDRLAGSARALRKQRYLVSGWCVDVHRDGLILAEGTGVCPFVGEEVTGQEHFEGHALAKRRSCKR